MIFTQTHVRCRVFWFRWVAAVFIFSKLPFHSDRSEHYLCVDLPRGHGITCERIKQNEDVKSDRSRCRKSNDSQFLDMHSSMHMILARHIQQTGAKKALGVPILFTIATVIYRDPLEHISYSLS